MVWITLLLPWAQVCAPVKAGTADSRRTAALYSAQKSQTEEEAEGSISKSAFLLWLSQGGVVGFPAQPCLIAGSPSAGPREALPAPKA